MEISVDLKGKDHFGDVVNIIQDALHILSPSPCPNENRFLEALTGLFAESDLWSSRMSEIRPMIKAPVPSLELVDHELANLNPEQRENLRVEADKRVQALGIPSDGPYYATNIDNESRRILLKGQINKWWTEVTSLAPELATLHLTLTNMADFKQNQPDDYNRVIEVLELAKNPEHRSDEVIFTYEVHDGEPLTGKNA